LKNTVPSQSHPIQSKKYRSRSFNKKYCSMTGLDR
jgi:hypothetical protein